MSWPDVKSIEDAIVGLTGYSEAGLINQLRNLVNQEINNLCTAPVPVSQKYAALTLEGMRDAVLPASIGTLLGILPDPSATSIQPIMWIRTEAQQTDMLGNPLPEHSFEYVERQFISLISVGFREASAVDQMCFLAAAVMFNCKGVLLDSSLIVYGGGGLVPTPANQEILRYRPVDEESVVVAEDIRNTYFGLAGSIETYAGIATGPPQKCALMWNTPPYIMQNPAIVGEQQQQLCSMSGGAWPNLESRPRQRAHLAFWPPPDKDYGIKAYYRRRPDPLENDADINLFTRTYPWLIINRLAAKIARAWMGNAERAEMYAEEADRELLNLVVHSDEFHDSTGVVLAPGASRYGKRRGIA